MLKGELDSLKNSNIKFGKKTQVLQICAVNSTKLAFSKIRKTANSIKNTRLPDMGKMIKGYYLGKYDNYKTEKFICFISTPQNTNGAKRLNLSKLQFSI